MAEDRLIAELEGLELATVISKPGEREILPFACVSADLIQRVIAQLRAAVRLREAIRAAQDSLRTVEAHYTSGARVSRAKGILRRALLAPAAGQEEQSG